MGMYVKMQQVTQFSDDRVVHMIGFNCLSTMGNLGTDPWMWNWAVVMHKTQKFSRYFPHLSFPIMWTILHYVSSIAVWGVLCVIPFPNNLLNMFTSKHMFENPEELRQFLHGQMESWEKRNAFFFRPHSRIHTPTILTYCLTKFVNASCHECGSTRWLQSWEQWPCILYTS